MNKEYLQSQFELENSSHTLTDFKLVVDSSFCVRSNFNRLLSVSDSKSLGSSPWPKYGDSSTGHPKLIWKSAAEQSSLKVWKDGFGVVSTNTSKDLLLDTLKLEKEIYLSLPRPILTHRLSFKLVAEAKEAGCALVGLDAIFSKVEGVVLSLFVLKSLLF